MFTARVLWLAELLLSVCLSAYRINETKISLPHRKPARNWIWKIKETELVNDHVDHGHQESVWKLIVWSSLKIWPVTNCNRHSLQDFWKWNYTPIQAHLQNLNWCKFYRNSFYILWIEKMRNSRNSPFVSVVNFDSILDELTSCYEATYISLLEAKYISTIAILRNRRISQDLSVYSIIDQ